MSAEKVSELFWENDGNKFSEDFSQIVLSVLVFLFPALILAFSWGHYLIAILLIVYSIFLLIRENNNKLVAMELDKLFLVLAVFPVILLASMYIKNGSWQGVDYTLKWFFLIPVALVLRNYKVRFSFFVYGIALGCFLSGMGAIFDVYVNGQERAGSYITNQIPYGQIAAILAGFSLLLFMRSSGFGERFLWIMAFFSAFVATLLSGSRGALLGLCVILLLFMWWLVKKSLRNLFWCVAYMFILLGIVLIFPQSERLLDTIKDYYAYSEGMLSSSVGERIELLKAASHMFGDNPFLGVGAGNFSVNLEYLVGNGVVSPVISGYSHAHSQYMDLLAVSGLFGFIGFLISFGGVFYFFYKKFLSSTGVRYYASLMGMMLVLMMMIFGVFHVIYAHNISVVFYFMMLLLCWYFCHYEVET